MKIKKILLVSSLVLMLLTSAFFSWKYLKPQETKAADVCKKNFYTNSDLVGYFRDIRKDDSYYITNDWCVVKAILWWGSVFEHYSDIAGELKERIDYIFPESQVYFGLIPAGFLGDTEGPDKGSFYTVGLLNYGYLKNDDPFKNIYGDNRPKPPIFAEDTKVKSKIAKPPAGTEAATLMKRMDDLHYKIFEPRVAKGQCKNYNKYPDLITACQYFANRVQTFIPPSYKTFTKAVGDL